MISEIFTVWCDFVNSNQLKWRKIGRACLRPYRNRGVVHFDVRKSASNVLLYMKDLQM